MKYDCKCPHKLTINGYCQKKLEEYQRSGQYVGLDQEIKNILWFVLLELQLIISSSKEKLQKNMDLLLKIHSISTEEYTEIPDEQKEPNNSFDTLFLIFRNPTDAAALIANNMDVVFNGDKQEQCAMFLQEVTLSFIKEITEINQVKSIIKRVRFNVENIFTENSEPPKKKYKQTSHKSSVKHG
jgi:hypothetical protein